MKPNETSEKSSWLGVAFMLLLLANLPFALWLAFMAPAVPAAMTTTDLSSSSFQLQFVFMLGAQKPMFILLAFLNGSFACIVMGYRVVMKARSYFGFC